MVKKVLPGYSKSVIWDTFYEIMFFAREEKGGIPMKIAEPNLLTLDYWRDEVSYQGITLPSGTIGCAALNIPDDVIDRLKQISLPLLAAVEAVNKLPASCKCWSCCRKKTRFHCWIIRITSSASRRSSPRKT